MKKDKKGKPKTNAIKTEIQSSFEHFSGGRYIVTLVRFITTYCKKEPLQGEQKEVIVTIYGITHCIHLLQRNDDKKTKLNE